MRTFSGSLCSGRRHLAQPLKHYATEAFDTRRLAAVLESSAVARDPRAGNAVHALLTKLHDSVGVSFSPWNKLLNLYWRCGLHPLARKVFDTMLHRDVVSYNTVLSVQSRSNYGILEAVRLYTRLLREDLKPDHITFSALLRATDCSPCPRLLEQIHAQTTKFGLNSNGFVGAAMVNAYERCRGMEEATAAFNEIAELDPVCWNVMIDACARRGSKQHVVKVFSRMQKEGGGTFDCFTMTSILKTCLEEGDLTLGMQLHGCAFKSGLEAEAPTGNALITMYLTCGGVSPAVEVFRSISAPNIISWTAMIAGLAQNERAEEAASFYREMVTIGERENDFCFASVLSTFSRLASLDYGKAVHCRIIKSAFCLDVVVINALIDMYFKCGSLDDAELAFESATKHDIVSWTNMILGFGQHGMGGKALDVFDVMKSRGFRPDSITFLAILSACSHGALVDEGLNILRSMVHDYMIKPKRAHCACIVDLLGRAGRLKEAELFIENTGIGMDSLAWEALLGASGMHGEMKLGWKSAEKVIAFDPQNCSPYVMLSNMYAGQSMWHEKEKLRERLDTISLPKETAHSWSPV